MASRRSGYDSLVHRHQLQNLLTRSFDSANENGEPDAAHESRREAEMSEGGSKKERAYGNQDIGRIASAIEESVPWSSGILDVFWPRVEAASGPLIAHDGQRPERPRPEKYVDCLLGFSRNRPLGGSDKSR
jgi:hypothetical protein